MIMLDRFNYFYMIHKNEQNQKENDAFSIIEERTKKYSKNFWGLIPKMISICFRASRLKKAGKDLEPIGEDLYRAARIMIPLTIEASHYMYELDSQIEAKIGKERLLEYVRKNGADEIEYAKTYNKKKNTMSKALALFAILKNEGITADKFKDTEIALGLMSGKKISDVIADKFEDLSYEAEEQIEDILDKEIDYSELEPEIHKLVEDYHKEYMEKNVYPYLPENNTVVNDEEKLLTLGFKAGKSIKKN